MATTPEKSRSRPGPARKLRLALVPVVIIAGLGLFLLLKGQRGAEKADTSNELLRITWRQTSTPQRLLEAPGPAGDSSPVSSAESDSTDPVIRQQMALADPGASGWASEALSEEASQALATLGKAMLVPADESKWADAAALVAEDFAESLLSQAGAEKFFQDRLFSIQRWNSAKGATEGANRSSGLAGFRTMADKFVGKLGGDSSPRLKFKITGVTVGDPTFETRVAVELVRKGEAGGALQRNAEWTCSWRKPANESDRPRLLSIVPTFQEDIQRASDQPVFRDCTEAVMREAESYRAQFLRGNDYWGQRLSILEGTSFLGHHGLAVGDVNGDQIDDLYVCDGGGLPNRLYLQNADGTLRDVSREAGVDWLEFTSAALLVDLDNDGDQDLVLATVAMVLFMSNDGDGKFTLEGAHHGVAQARSLCAGDYDNDGDLDIYVTSYANPNKADGFGTRGVSSSIPIPYNDANNGSPNALLKNNGKFRFVDATKEAGLDERNTRFSFAASWEDFDHDGDLDLYVANDFGRNCLYRNDGGKFREVAGELGVEDMASGMSVSWGDCNGDGWPDLYVGNMFSAAGQRIAYQRSFGNKRTESDLSGLRRMARGNSLFLGKGNGGAFADVSEDARVTMGRWAWSSQFTDLNNDGLLDLVVGNGFLTNRQPDDL